MKKQLLIGLLAIGMAITAQAVPFTGAITFKGGIELDTASVNTATKVTGWLDQGGNLPTVASRSGGFNAFVNVGDSATFAAPWSFNSAAVPAFWTIDGYSFALISSHIVSQGGGFVTVSGTGSLSGNNADPVIGVWNFSSNDPSAGTPAVFSFSASSNFVPDGGTTASLLGFGLVAVEAMRRKMRMAKI